MCDGELMVMLDKLAFLYSVGDKFDKKVKNENYSK